MIKSMAGRHGAINYIMMNSITITSKLYNYNYNYTHFEM